ncbi:MAG: cysteine desulfurase family protein [Desulfobacterales bacterium]|nr:cysteine desulfurase family protein [Desulfobacterales bacterium]
METVYMDHAAATPVRSEAIEAMLPYFDREFANPSTLYASGAKVQKDIEEQREKVAGLIGAETGEIVFTASGAEANNMALKGVPLARRKKGSHVVISGIEHHSVLNSARFLQQMDFEVSYLPVDETGLVDPEKLERSIRPETVLVSVMHGNNEIGTVQPIDELSAVCRSRGVLMHTDAVATAGQIPVNVDELNVDLLSLSAPSLRGSKGVGALYIRGSTRVMPLIHGGIQERGRRAGTENVPGIIGFGKAAELAVQELEENAAGLRTLRDRLKAGIQDRIGKIRFTGHPEKRLPGHLSLCFEAIEGEALVFLLSQQGICINTGSACASKALKTSPVLTAISVKPEIAHGSAVFTLSPVNTQEDVDYVIETLPQVVDKLRSYSPLWEEKAAAGSKV